MKILENFLLKDLIELANNLELKYKKSSKKEDLKDLIEKYLEENQSSLESGTLDIIADSYGFLRNTTLENDIYVSASQIKRFKLRKNDMVFGEVRKPYDNKTHALRRVIKVNNLDLETAENRVEFENLTPAYPTEQFTLGKDSENISGRIIDLFAPIGKGQRALIISPPKAGKTTFVSSIAKALIKDNKDAEVWILLIDERPEEVTDIVENVKGAKVFASTFDEDSRNHIKVTEEVIELAKAKVENGENIVILLDSLTRLSRAYNIVIPSSGKLLSGGIDPSALYYPKNFFGSARNIRNGGSLTIIATILVDTGSKMDDIIYEEFKSTGNCDIYLDRHLAELRIFPAIDIEKSGTRKEEVLISEKDIKKIWDFRRHLSSLDSKVTAISSLIKAIKKTKNNQELLKIYK